jgi:hypothetical protein
MKYMSGLPTAKAYPLVHTLLRTQVSQTLTEEGYDILSNLEKNLFPLLARIEDIDGPFAGHISLFLCYPNIKRNLELDSQFFFFSCILVFAMS